MKPGSLANTTDTTALRKRFLVLLSLVIVLALQPIGPAARAQAAGSLSILKLDDSAFPELSAVISVMSGGHPIAGLKASDFTVSNEAGASTPVETAGPASGNQAPVGVVIAIDRSGSMADSIAAGQGRKINIARQSAKNLIAQLADGDQAGVVSFATSVATHQTMTTDHGAATAAVDRIPEPNGWTALYDAALTAIDEAHSSGLTRTAVILLTDGREEGPNGAPSSQGRQQDVIDRANQFGVSLLTIGVGDDQDAEGLRTLASATGGTYSDARSADGVQQAFADAAQTLRTLYQVTFRANSPADGKSHTFQLHVTLPGSASATGSGTFTSKPVPPGLTISTHPLGGASSPLQDGATLPLSTSRAFVFDAGAPGGIAQLRYDLDGQAPSTVAGPPFGPVTLDPLQLTVGDHALVVEATDVAGNVASRHATIQVPALPPPVQVQGLTPNSTLKGTVEIRPLIGSKQGAIREAAYRLDGRSPQVFREPPFAYVLSTGDLARGKHELRIVVTDSNGQQGSYDLPFRLAGAAFNPAVLIVFAAAALIMSVATALIIARRRRPGATSGGARVAPAAVSGIVSAQPERLSTLGTSPVAVAAPAALVQVRKNGRQTAEVEITQGEDLTIGREGDCGLRLEDRGVSRHHARISAEGETYRIEDLASMFGTWCNGTKLESGRPVELRDGSEIRVGPYRLRFQRR